MAGTIVADTLENGTGTTTSMTNAIRGCAKAWATFAAATTTPTIVGSYNTSSITYVGTGTWNVALTTAMPSTAYAVVFGQGQNTSYNTVGNTCYNLTTSGFTLQHYENGAVYNVSVFNFALFD
jgi:hypothetical protein